MPIRTKCPSCQTTLTVPDTAAGKSARCQACQQIFKVPSPSRPSAASPQAVAPQKTAKAPAPAGRVLKCPGCQAAMRIPAGSQGKLLACPRCQKKFRVPGLPAAKPAAPVKPRPRAPVPSPPASSNVGAGGLDDFDFGDLGAGSMSGSNPYAAPSQGSRSAGAYAPPRQYAAHSRPAERSLALYVIPGVFILIWSLLIVVGAIVRIVSLAIVLATNEIPAAAWPRVGALFGGALVGITIGIVMALGSVNMIRQMNLSSARTTAIMASIPCLGCFVFPIGIWATVLLFTGSVKKDFYD